MAVTYGNIMESLNMRDIRNNYIPDDSGVGYPKRAIFMGTNTQELYINNNEFLVGSIVFLPQENKFMVYTDNKVFTEIQIQTDKDNNPEGLLINGIQYDYGTVDETCRKNIEGNTINYGTAPDELNKLI
jgi:hypothetical protein